MLQVSIDFLTNFLIFSLASGGSAPRPPYKSIFPILLNFSLNFRENLDKIFKNYTFFIDFLTYPKKVYIPFSIFEFKGRLWNWRVECLLIIFQNLLLFRFVPEGPLVKTRISWFISQPKPRGFAKFARIRFPIAKSATPFKHLSFCPSYSLHFRPARSCLSYPNDHTISRDLYSPPQTVRNSCVNFSNVIHYPPPRKKSSGTPRHPPHPRHPV